jgi:hypothetical protein
VTRSRTRAAAALFTALLGTALLGTPNAHAQDASRKAAAQQLFDEALKLIDAGKYGEACPKLARSQDLAPSGGTLLNLGDCFEKNGQYASAWSAFREAASRAATAGLKQAETAAIERASRVEPKVIRLKIILAPGADLETLEIRRDGVRVKRSELELEVPVDPGEHKFEAQAFQRKRWTAVMLINASTPHAELTIPVLEPEGGPAGPKPESAELSKTVETTKWSTQQTVGAVVAGAGVVALGFGAFFGFSAISSNNEALTHCRSVNGTERCDPTGLSLTDDASSQALASTILVGVGIAAVGGGAFLFFTAPKGEKRALQAAPLVGRSSGGVSIQGTF